MRILDASECKAADYPTMIGLTFDLGMSELEKLSRDNSLIYAQATYEALAWEEALRQRPSVRWICGAPGASAQLNVLPPAERNTARARQSGLLYKSSKELYDAAMAAGLPVNPDGFRIISFPGLHDDTRPLFWLDRDHLVFSGIAPGAAIKRGAVNGSRYIWNLSSGSISNSYSWEERSYWCVCKGYSSYFVTKREERVFYGGPLGSEVELARRPLDNYGPTISGYDCRIESPGSPNYDPVKGTRLAGKDGYMRVIPRPGLANEPVFYKGDSSTPQTFPFPASSFRTFSYAVYPGAYLLRTDTRVHGEGDINVWKLSPDGSLERISVPNGPWARASMGFSYSVAGLIMYSHAVRGQGPGNAGLYLIRDGKITRIFAGYLESYGNTPDQLPVSADGCRVAVTMSHLPDESQYLHRLFVVDFCSRSQK
ncbi:MAG TPA: hypothetical protein VFV84_10475 [Burkholderiales bacterium]|nr:hypothetical protein [Burkholderiales bacterium]